MARKPCVPKISCTRRTSTSRARSARPCCRRKGGTFSLTIVFFSFAEPIVMRLASILRKRRRFRLRRTGEAAAPCRKDAARSEEHTSELQSRLHLVCRLLLEKKKKKIPWGRLKIAPFSVFHS